MLLAMLLLQPPAGPTVADADWPDDRQWHAIQNTPRVTVRAFSQSDGSGYVVGVKDGTGYVLTASHVLPFEAAGLRFASRPNYPAWGPPVAAQLVKRSEVNDLAMLTFAVKDIPAPPIPGRIAPPWDRPKSFPVKAFAVGIGEPDSDPGSAGPTVWRDDIRGKRFRPTVARPAFFWETNRPPVGGRSGGPLLDASGRLIGICSATQDGRGYYTHHDELVATLREWGYDFLLGGP